MKRGKALKLSLVLFIALILLMPASFASLSDSIDKMNSYVDQYKEGKLDAAKLVIYLEYTKNQLYDSLDKNEEEGFPESEVKSVLGESEHSQGYESIFSTPDFDVVIVAHPFFKRDKDYYEQREDEADAYFRIDYDIRQSKGSTNTDSIKEDIKSFVDDFKDELEKDDPKNTVETLRERFAKIKQKMQSVKRENCEDLMSGMFEVSEHQDKYRDQVNYYKKLKIVLMEDCRWDNVCNNVCEPEEYCFEDCHAQQVCDNNCFEDCHDEDICKEVCNEIDLSITSENNQTQDESENESEYEPSDETEQTNQETNSTETGENTEDNYQDQPNLPQFESICETVCENEHVCNEVCNNNCHDEHICEEKCEMRENCFQKCDPVEYCENRTDGEIGVNGVCGKDFSDIHINAWGPDLDFYNELNHFDQGFECEEQLESLVKLRKAFQDSVDDNLVEWFYEDFIGDDPEKVINGESGLHRVLDVLTRNEEEISHNLHCDKEMSYWPKGFENIDITYQTKNANIEIWEKRIPVEGTKVKYWTTLYKYAWMPDKSLIKKLIDHKLSEEETIGPSKKEIAEIKSDEGKMELINRLAEKYGGSFDVKLELVDEQDAIVTKYLHVNPDVAIQIDNDLPNNGKSDISVSIDYNVLYSFISYINFEIEGDQIKGPYWVEIHEDGGPGQFFSIIGALSKMWRDGVKIRPRYAIIKMFVNAKDVVGLMQDAGSDDNNYDSIGANAVDMKEDAKINGNIVLERD